MLLKCSYTTDISIKNYVGLSRNLDLKHHFHPYIRRGHLIVKQRGINCLKFMTFENIFKKERGIFKSLLIVYGLVAT